MLNGFRQAMLRLVWLTALLGVAGTVLIAGRQVNSDSVITQFAQRYRTQISSGDCYWSEDQTGYQIQPACVLLGILPKLSFKQAIDLSRSQINNFSDVYDLKSTWFTYAWATPILNTKVNISSTQILNPLLRTQNQWLRLLYEHTTKKPLHIKKIDLALNMLGGYHFAVANRQIANYGECSKINYRRALGILDGLYLKPGESFNINKALANLTGYCMGQNPGQYLFYQGVCWAATQLFRVSLLSPEITILKRQGHSQRYVRYYDETVFGDDAAIYERQKVFEIQNNASTPIYFKTLSHGYSTYLVWITPTIPNSYVQILRQQIGQLKGQVSKIVISKTNQKILSNQERVSHYGAKNYEQN